MAQQQENRLSRYCDHLHLLIVQKQSTYIRDFKPPKIESFTLPKTTTFISYDITSIYTNIKFAEWLRMLYWTLPDQIYLILFDFLWRYILENNYFEWNWKYYKQVIDAVMGTRPSPEINDIPMNDISEEIIFISSMLTKHFITVDLGWQVHFSKSSAEIRDFFHIGNSCHKMLKFASEISDTSITFLGTTVYKGIKFSGLQIRYICSNIKPTNNFQYVHRQSAHIPSV